MTSYTPRMALVVASAIALLVWRARLEEKLLSAHSPAYREWMRRTGFLWPRRAAAAPEHLVVAEMESATCKMPNPGISGVIIESSSTF